MESITLVPKHFSIKGRQFKKIVVQVGCTVAPIPGTRSYTIGYDQTQQLIDLGTALGQYVKANSALQGVP